LQLGFASPMNLKGLRTFCKPEPRMIFKPGAFTAAVAYHPVGNFVIPRGLEPGTGRVETVRLQMPGGVSMPEALADDTPARSRGRSLISRNQRLRCGKFSMSYPWPF
jgi:hypothetical protein